MYQELLTLHEHLSSSPFCFPWFLVGSVLLIFLVFVLSYYVYLLSEFRVVMSVTITALKWCSVRPYLQMFVGELIFYLRYLCLFVYSLVQHILYCVFALFFCVWCAICCQFPWIVYFWLPLGYCLTIII